MTDRKLAAMPGAMAENFKTREAAAQGLREKWEVRDRSGRLCQPPRPCRGLPVSLGWEDAEDFKQGERTSVAGGCTEWPVGGASTSSRQKVKVKSLSPVRLFVTPWTVAYQVPPSMGFSRQEYWDGLPFPSPGDLPNTGIEPRSPAL